MQLATAPASLPVQPPAPRSLPPISAPVKPQDSRSPSTGIIAAFAAAAFARNGKLGKVARFQQKPANEKEAVKEVKAKVKEVKAVKAVEEVNGAKEPKKVTRAKKVKEDKEAKETKKKKTAPVAKKSKEKKPSKAKAKAKESAKAAAKDPKMEAFTQKFLKKYGEGSLMSCDAKSAEVPTFSTGALTLDLALGGGLPFGRIIEVFGPEMSGKTTLALSCARQVQLHGERKRVAFVDAEEALDLSLAKAMGIDLKNLTLIPSTFAEEACDKVVHVVESGMYDLVIVDSVAALTPEEESKKDMGQMTIGLVARVMSKFLRKVTKSVKDTNTCLLMINQLRANIGGYGPSEVTCGGKALPYAASVRMEVRSPMSGKIGPTDEPTGIRSNVRIKKNKLAAPHRIAGFDITYGQGISWESSVLEAGINEGVIKKGGAWLSYGEGESQVKVQGKEKMKAVLEENAAMCKKVEEEVRASWKKKETEEEEEEAAAEPEEVQEPAAEALVEA